MKNNPGSAKTANCSHQEDTHNERAELLVGQTWVMSIKRCSRAAAGQAGASSIKHNSRIAAKSKLQRALLRGLLPAGAVVVSTLPTAFAVTVAAGI